MTEHDPHNPFPGFRPFGSHQSHLFFGREEQIDMLLGRLGDSRLVAVVGASGSGKSSLVRAGLVPALLRGASPGLGGRWTVAVTRPGGAPIRNLAGVLASPEVLGDETDRDDAAAMFEALLRRSGLGLAELAAVELSEHRRLLVVVDQFEELFRFDGAGHDEAAAFVTLLIEASGSDTALTYVVLTMRSEFLGDCSDIAELPGAINDGLHLVSRMSRDERRHAVTGPMAVAGSGAAPRLVQRLHNDTGTDPSRLPVLQHALMRTWDVWAERRSGPLDLEHYEATGGVGVALSRHADEAYEDERLSDRDRRLAEGIFKRLTATNESGVETRSPTSLAELGAVCGAPQEDVARVVRHFSGTDTSFLVTSDDDVVDISHESLIREWDRLSGWVAAEGEAAGQYRRLLDSAERNAAGIAGRLENPELGITTAWWREYRPNAAWARRYGGGYELAHAYLERSKKSFTRRRRLIIGSALLVLVAGLGLFYWNRQVQIDRTQEKVQLLDDLAEAEARLRTIELELVAARAEGADAGSLEELRDDAEQARSDVEEARDAASEVVRVSVPDLLGSSDRSGDLDALGLVAQVTRVSDETIPNGQLISQDPASGTEVARGSVVTIVESSGPAQRPESIDEVRVGQSPRTPVDGYGLIWVPNFDDGTVSVIDPDQRAVVATIVVGAGPFPPVAASELIWVPSFSGGTISVIDPDQLAVIDTIQVGSNPLTPFEESDLIWVPNFGDGTVSVIDPDRRAVTDTIAVGSNAVTPLVDDGLIWVPDARGTVAVIDADERAVVDTVLVGADPRTPLADGGLIWVPNSGDGTVSVIDPDQRAVTDTIPVGVSPVRPVAANGFIWVPNSGDRTMSVIDPARRAVVGTIPLGESPVSSVTANGFIWVPNKGDGTVSMIDPGQRSVVDTVRVGADPSPALAANDLIWVPNTGGSTVSVIEPPQE